MSEQQYDASPEESADLGVEVYIPEVVPQEGYFGFTLREIVVAVLWFVSFVLSFFPLGTTALGRGLSVWSADGQWLLTVVVPTVAVFLLVLRRLSPEGIRRVGSLGIDQFASVAFTVSAATWAVIGWQQIHIGVVTGTPLWETWAGWVQLLLALALVALTVFGPLIPRIREDFQGREESLAHRIANPVRPVVARPRKAKTAVSSSDADAVDDVADADAPERTVGDHASGGASGVLDIGGLDETYEPGYARSNAPDTPLELSGSRTQRVLAEAVEVAAPTANEEPPAKADAPVDIDAVLAEAAEAAESVTEVVPDIPAIAPAQGPAAQPFWALAPDRRPVHDDRGQVVYEIGPDAWILVLEDRGGAYVVRHEDGRVGYLHDTTNMTRG